MDARKLFVVADQALKDVIDQIKPDQWGMGLAEWFQVRHGQEEMKLRDIVSYHAYDEAWVPDTLAGKTVEEVGDSHGSYGDDLLGDDPKATYDQLFQKATTAVKALDDLDKKVHLSYGEWPARDYLWHISTFRGLRSFEIAKLIGIDTTMPKELVDGLLEIITPHAEEWRQMGVFGPALEASADASDQVKLLALTGRLP
jgi:uncharacterized protein (TIGR03086 family)